MRIRIVVLAVVTFIALIACGEGDPPDAESASTPASPSPSPSATFGAGRVLLDTDEGSMFIDVEVADTSELRQLGLMHRESLDEDVGMVFVFFEEQQGGFWMKNTLIPLSIAFFDVDGKIVKILDMEPCEADPCPIYNPGAKYMGALEVNQGAFDRWGVEEGDSIILNR
jgi:uncharacterized membrane protein (UPF0127 family)